jgi:hypothetical protein
MSTERTEALASAYRRTRYRVLLPAGPLELVIGQASADADRRLRVEAACKHCWSLLTACNPRSQRLSVADNRARQAALQRLLVERGAGHYPSLHRDPLGHWPDEDGFLLLDPEAGLSEQLGRHFEQNAVVRGRLGEPPQLLWL